jgi:hypothetical protein
MRLDAVVGHGQQGHAGLPSVAQRGGHLRQPVAGVEHLRADEVGREVAVAKPEPAGLDPVRGELLFGVPRLVFAPPAALVVDAAAERVHHRVEVGADPEPEHPDVVGGVADNGDRVGLGIDYRAQAGEEARTADAA